MQAARLTGMCAAQEGLRLLPQQKEGIVRARSSMVAKLSAIAAERSSIISRLGIQLLDYQRVITAATAVPRNQLSLKTCPGVPTDARTTQPGRPECHLPIAQVASCLEDFVSKWLCHVKIRRLWPGKYGIDST